VTALALRVIAVIDTVGYAGDTTIASDVSFIGVWNVRTRTRVDMFCTKAPFFKKAFFCETRD